MNSNSLIKKYLGYYLLWSFLHLVFLAVGWNGEGHDNFWPFSDGYRDSLNEAYDFSEFLVYVLGPVILLIALNSIIWGGVEDKIDEEIRKRSS